MPRLGQHFLLAGSVATTIAESLAPYAPRTIIEVGPGHGELTQALRRAHPRAKIIAIEMDARLAAALAARGIEAPFNTIEGDALALLPELATQIARGKPDEPCCIAGNIPYYITGHLLRIVGALNPKPRATVFMIQREVAERAAAGNGNMNRLAASIQLWAHPKIIARVPRIMFSPPPEVDSAVLLLEAKTNAPSGVSTGRRSDPHAYDRALTILFAQPRKTLYNNLRARIPEAQAKALLAETGLDIRARPSDLSIEQIAKLSSRIPHTHVLE